ncbi:NAD(P)-dependent oxidoreductase [Rhodosalinus halophilus]|uniref:NAD(P)-dependent oxidoreductase n=1 Tax=Rhodosalinus halophilus TaxID=2259333 RepID=A0A365UCP7_9RHOB|nr:SDR family oxidoreductase [Rhodosalinus halophilus]RBI86277.1 NAD(P)-dependent oxidoreductase [Rhodosalinus halophilus]
MERILVIGASRGIGLQVVRQGLDRGLRIRAMARSAEQMADEGERLDRFAGDATDPADLARALDGQEAVILALGVPPGLGFVYRPVTLFSRATEALVPLMEAQGPRRLLAVTGFGAGDSEAAISTLERLPFRAIMGRAYDDKTRQEAAIRASALDWTIARPGILTNGPRTSRYKVLVEPSEWRNGMISRADVAEFLLDAAQTGGYLREAPVLVR